MKESFAAEDENQNLENPVALESNEDSLDEASIDQGTAERSNGQAFDTPTYEQRLDHQDDVNKGSNVNNVKKDTKDNEQEEAKDKEEEEDNGEDDEIEEKEASESVSEDSDEYVPSDGEAEEDEEEFEEEPDDSDYEDKPSNKTKLFRKATPIELPKFRPPLQPSFRPLYQQPFRPPYQQSIQGHFQPMLNRPMNMPYYPPTFMGSANRFGPLSAEINPLVNHIRISMGDAFSQARWSSLDAGAMASARNFPVDWRYSNSPRPLASPSFQPMKRTVDVPDQSNFVNDEGWNESEGKSRWTKKRSNTALDEDYSGDYSVHSPSADQPHRYNTRKKELRNYAEDLADDDEIEEEPSHPSVRGHGDLTENDSSLGQSPPTNRGDGMKRELLGSAKGSDEHDVDEDDSEKQQDPDGVVGSEEEEEEQTIDKVLDYREVEQKRSRSKLYEFLIKWRDRSHLYNTWNTFEQLREFKGFKKAENYLKLLQEEQRLRKTMNEEEVEQRDVEREMYREILTEYTQVERVIATRDGPQGENTAVEVQYLCKWIGLPYSECTWEPAEMIAEKFQKEIDSFLERNQSQQLPNHNASLAQRFPFIKLEKQPDYFVGGELRDYQLEGINWLIFAWCKHDNAILADEMGLGKTIQAICFLSFLFHQKSIFGPFLIIVPLSTISAWQREFSRWAPDMNLVVYLGDAKSRQMIMEHEFYLTGSSGRPAIKFNVLLTTFEVVLKDQEELRTIRWAHFLVDEAHRLKNTESLLHDTLRDFWTAGRLLITGTPLQNTIKELWSLLNFLMPRKFNSLERFEIAYADLKQEDQIRKLHEELRPHLLRRVKKDVEKSLPAKFERILRVDLSGVQKRFYRWILTKNYKALSKGIKGNRSSLLNIIVELKKCCNHPFLMDDSESGTEKNARLDSLIQSSGKMVLLDKLLVRLKETGHRVLIFSQMVRMLEILGEYMWLRGFTYQSLDGSVASEDRKKSIDRFNAPNSTDFAFLLSTRAGGLGINLETADTVIIYDSDWNPQNDLQAMARAHRIGQKNVVNIYRLISRSTVEEDILERAKRKMVLDHLVIQKMDSTGRAILSSPLGQTADPNYSKEEIAAIIKFGAQDLFAEGHEIARVEVDIDEILARAEKREAVDDVDKNNEFLSQFKFADFGLPEKSDDLDWEDIIPKSERSKVDDNETGKSSDQIIYEPRKRKTVQSYSALLKMEKERRRKPKKDSRSPSPRKKTGRRAKSSKSATETEFAHSIYTALKKFGDCPERISEFVKEPGLEDVSSLKIKSAVEDVLQACDEAIKSRQDSKPAFEFLGVSFDSLELHDRIEGLRILRNKVSKAKAGQFRLTLTVKPPQNWSCKWTQKDDSLFLVGIHRYGFGAWESIRLDSSLGLRDKIFIQAEHRSTSQSPKASHLDRRGRLLLKLLRDHEHRRKIQPRIDEDLAPKKLSSSTRDSDRDGSALLPALDSGPADKDRAGSDSFSRNSDSEYAPEHKKSLKKRRVLIRSSFSPRKSKVAKKSQTSDPSKPLLDNKAA